MFAFLLSMDFYIQYTNISLYLVFCACSLSWKVSGLNKKIYWIGKKYFEFDKNKREKRSHQHHKITKKKTNGSVCQILMPKGTNALNTHIFCVRIKYFLCFHVAFKKNDEHV